MPRGYRQCHCSRSMQERLSILRVSDTASPMVVIANIVLAIITIARADSVRPHHRRDLHQTGSDADADDVGRSRRLQHGSLHRCLPARRTGWRIRVARPLLTEAFGRIISMPLSWHSQRGTSNALHTLLRACETLFGLWLEFMRKHLSTAVALVAADPDGLCHGPASLARARRARRSLLSSSASSS